MALLKTLKSAAFSVVLTIALIVLCFVCGTQVAKADPGFAYDTDHDVLMLPDCEVAIRYNNKTFVPVKAVSTLGDGNFFLKETPVKAFKIYEDYSSAGMKSAPEQIIVESYDVGKIGAFGTSRFNKDFLAKNRVREVQFTNARVCAETGLTDTSFIGITAEKSFEIATKNGDTPYYLHVFQTPTHLTLFARLMRSTSREFDLDPAVIVTQFRVNNVASCVGNVQLDDAGKKVVTQ